MTVGNVAQRVEKASSMTKGVFYPVVLVVAAVLGVSSGLAQSAPQRPAITVPQ